MPRSALVPLMLAALLGACARTPQPLPETRYQSLEEARQILIDRQDSIETVQAKCDVLLTRPDGETTTLDGALVLAGDDRMRLRTWKFNQVVFDLIDIPQGRYLFASDRLEAEGLEGKADLNQLSQHLGRMLRGPDFQEATLRRATDLTAAEFGSALPRDASLADALEARWERAAGWIDGRTLTPQVFRIDGDQAVTLRTDFAIYDGRYWLERLRADGDFGRLELRFRDVTINGQLNPRAFQPPPRAQPL